MLESESHQNRQLLDKFLDSIPIKTYSLVRVLEFFSQELSSSQFDEILQDLRQRYFVWTNQIKEIKDPKQRAKKGFQLFEKEMALHDLSSASCKKGCGYCCHWKVDVTDEEASILSDLIETGTAKVNMERLEAQSKWTTESSIWKNPTDKSKCIFLGKNGSCSIYENRPITCRKALVESNPIFCKTNDRNEISPLFIPELELLTSVIWSHTAGDVDILPKQVWKKLYKTKRVHEK